jgi:hypothetical protein
LKRGDAGRTPNWPSSQDIQDGFFEEYQEYRPSKPFEISISHAVRQLESFKNFKNAVENVTFLVRRRADFQHCCLELTFLVLLHPHYQSLVKSMSYRIL